MLSQSTGSATSARVKSFSLTMTVLTSLSLSLAGSLSGLVNCGEAAAQMAGTPVQTDATGSAYSRPSKEFKFRKRYIAPSSDLYHRIDYASMPSRDALMLPTYEPQYGKGAAGNRPSLNYQPIHPDDPQEALKAQAQSLSAKSTGIKPMANRDGLTPPPPPANQKLLPTSLNSNDSARMGSPAPVASAAPLVSQSNLSAAQIAHIKGQADALVKQGHLGEAQDLLSRTVQTHPHEPVLRAQLSKISLDRARYFAKQGNAQEAASQSRMAIAYGSAYSNASESAYSLLASNLTKAGVDPRNPDARASLGASLLAANKPVEAEIEYRQAIKLKPTADFYIGAGSAAQAGGNRTSAKLDYQKALEMQPDSQAALSKLGILRYQMKDYVGANADLTRALVMNGQDTVAAQSLIELWQKQVASRPTDAGSHLGLARAYQVTGDLDSAKGEYKTVVKLDPKHPNLPAARQSFKLALARREAYKSFDSAHSLETQGQLAQAYQKASDAVELYPSETNFQTYKTQLAGQLQAAGMPVYAAQGQAMQALSNIVQQGSGQAAQAGLATAAGAQAPAAPQSPMAADNMYRPLTTDNHVNSMSGFLSSLRNFTMQQQAQQQAYETTASQTIAGIAGVPAPAGLGSSALGLGGALPGEGPAAASLSGIPGFAPSSPLPGVTGSLDQGQQTSHGPVTAQSALQAAAQALGNTRGGFVGGVASGYGATGTAAGAAVGGAASALGGSSAATGASTLGGVSTLGGASTLGSTSGLGSMALAAAPAVAPTMINGVGKAASYLKNHNATKTQTQATGTLNTGGQSGSTTPGATNYGFTPSGNFATQQTMPTTVTQRTLDSNPGGAVATAQSMSMTPQASTANVADTTGGAWPQPKPLGDAIESTPTNIAAVGDPNSQATALALAPPIVAAAPPTGVMPGGDLAGQAGAAPQTPLRSLIPPGAVKLYLTGVKAGKNEVTLLVSLRNDGAATLKMPSGIKAIVRTTGQPDMQGKINFDNKVIASGQTATGTIRVPGKSLDPTADVIIPTGTLTSGTIADIHLSVPISSK